MNENEDGEKKAQRRSVHVTNEQCARWGECVDDARYVFDPDYARAVINALLEDRLEAARLQQEQLAAALKQADLWQGMAQANLVAEMAVTERMLEQRQRVLDAIPPCPLHGPCVPHALDWIEKAKHLFLERDGA